LQLPSYAGVYALNARAVATRASEGWLVVNVDSHDKLPSDPLGNVPRNYAASGNTDRETSYFLNMYLRDSRALDYLTTRPDWDGKTIVLMGTSMGGQQSIVLAGLRPEKITAVLVCVPSGTDAEALPMIESEHNNLTPQKEQNWDARSKELLGVLLTGGEFQPNELK
jgi:dienelactone hydrolase